MTSKPKWYGISIVAAAMWCLIAGGEAAAAVFTVNSTADQVDADQGDGVCADADGKCTLRAAIQEANATVAVDTVRLRAGLYRLTIPGTYEYSSATGDLNIVHSLNIIGAGANVTIVDGSGLDRVLRIDVEPSEQGKVSISKLTIQNGSAPNGGGLQSSGATLSMKDCNVLRNRATESGGGMYLTLGDYAFERIKVKNNLALSQGGGICGVGKSSVAFSGCEVSGNALVFTSGSVIGGGICMQSNTLTITGGRISDNVALGWSGASGGGIYVEADTLKINGTTISDNHVKSTTKGFLSEGGGGCFRVKNVSFKGTVTGNTAFGDRVYGGGFKIIGSESIQITSSSITNNQVVAMDSGLGGGAYLTNAPVVQINSSSLTGNSVSAPIAYGGGLTLAAPSTLTRVRVNNNSILGSAAAYGGGIVAYEPLTLNNSSVESNTAIGPDGQGGGIYSLGDGAPHDIEIMKASRIKYNFASTDGGGIFQLPDPPSPITKSKDSVVSGNLPNNSVPPLP